MQHRNVPRLHGQTLVEMNLAAFTGRRDAAVELLTRVLRTEMHDRTRDERVELYGLCLELLDEAIHSTRSSQIRQDTPLLHYLQLLKDTVGAGLAMVKHEITISREAKLFAKLLGPRVHSRLQSANVLISAGEGNLLVCIEDLLTFGTAVRQQDTKRRQTRFKEADRQRYRLARAEYRRHYKERAAAARPA